VQLQEFETQGRAAMQKGLQRLKQTMSGLTGVRFPTNAAVGLAKSILLLAICLL
jgi:hypothetical protein